MSNRIKSSFILVIGAIVLAIYYFSQVAISKNTNLTVPAIVEVNEYSSYIDFNDDIEIPYSKQPYSYYDSDTEGYEELFGVPTGKYKANITLYKFDTKYKVDSIQFLDDYIEY